MKAPVLAVVDIGSNSIKVLVAAPGPGGATGPEIVPLFQETSETRISGGLGQDGSQLGEGGMEAGLTAVTRLLDQAATYGPTHRKVVATSAVRDARNRAQFAGMVEAATGVQLEVLSGDDEALLIARGIQTDPALNGADTFSIVDLGGGSLECIRYAQGKIEEAVSLQLGSVRLTEKYVPEPHQPFPDAARAAIETETRRQLAESGFKFPPGGKIVASGGAFTLARAILAHRLGCKCKSDWPAEITRADLLGLLNEMAPLSTNDRARIEKLTPERADIMPAALVTILALMDVAGVDRVYHSFNNLRFGVAARFFAQLHQQN